MLYVNGPLRVMKCCTQDQDVGCVNLFCHLSSKYCSTYYRVQIKDFTFWETFFLSLIELMFNLSTLRREFHNSCDLQYALGMCLVYWRHPVKLT